MVGTILANGATVLNAKHTTDKWILLCQWRGNEYVTWAMNSANEIEVDGATYWGHYFFDLANAERDFDNRVRRGY